jgi:hypothetical protein
MARLKPSILLFVGASAAALAGLLVACAHGKSDRVADASAAAIPDRPDWNWDVVPILSQNCFSCHGQATQKGGLRLDTKDAAYGELPQDKGKHAIVPGSLARSELYRRITITDVDYKMPPKEMHKTLSAHDVAVIKRWIEQGAKYKQHWSYITPEVVKPQKTKWDSQAVNPIDRYVYARLAKDDLNPSPEADRETLINRVYLDLTGLPPTLQQVDAFVADKDPGAYEKVVDKLLASKEYAERQTNIWLDVARYADSRGGLNDGERPITFPYRDWLISAFQRNVPYDKFVTWQLAGDQLPGATREQVLATAFLRAGRQDSEGGAIDEEYRMNYVEERAELIGKDFLGLTVGCAKCHNHKYDVISQADYYSLAGFFNQMDERGTGSGNRGTPMGPTLEWPTALQSRKMAAAHADTVAKEAAYQNALRAAQASASRAVDAVPAQQRVAAIKASIDADTQAYYPFDDGYKASFASLYMDPQPIDPGSALPGTKFKITRAQATAELQKKILADVRAGKPTPMLGDDAPPAMQAQGGAKGSDKAPAKVADKGEAPARAAHEGKPGLVKASLVKDGADGPGAKKKPGAKQAFRLKRAVMAGEIAAMKADPGLPRIASYEVDDALEQLVASGYQDDRLSNIIRISKHQLPVGLQEDQLLWSKSGLQGGAPAALNNVKLVPGVKGQAVQLHDSVVFADKSVGMFERTQPYTLDFWVKLRAKPYADSTRPNGPSASILYNNGGVEGLGYELSLDNGKLSYSITHVAPANMLKVSTVGTVPAGRWVHVTSTYDGNSRAAGMKLYLDGKPAPVEIEHDHLTRSAYPRGANSLFGSYFGLAAGTNFNRPELVDGAIDELRVITRALTPVEVAYLQAPSAAAAAPAAEMRAQMIQVAAQKDPAVQKAWADLTEARLKEQRIETPVYQIMVAGDQMTPRVNYLLDRGVYNSYVKPVEAQAPPRVFAWNAKLPRNRLGLAEWMFDPKNPLTARVYVNRMWQNLFGAGIVQTVDDFGMQGSNPTNPQLLDYLAVEFVRSGWDLKHMQKLMVMSATYRQRSDVTREALEKDPPNFLLERGPRFRMPAEILRDNALAASGLLVSKVGGDGVFPYAPDAIWDGVAANPTAAVYPTNVPDDEMHRRSMYTYVKRNAPVANLVVFDMPDRNNATVARTISNTPLQALVMLNDTQFIEAYRKVAERAIKSSANPDQQLVTLFRLGVRRRPDAEELAEMRRYRASETALMSRSPDEVKKLLANGVAPADASIDPVQLAAMSVVAAGVMNTPDAYTLR